MFILVAYDINECENEDNAKRASKVFKMCKRYLFRLQKSVFYGELDKIRYKELKEKLSKLVLFDTDSLTILSAKNKNNIVQEFLTKDKDINTLIIGGSDR
jgi:CRISPR-associated protein Cas2